MAWVALREGARLARDLRAPTLAEQWMREADVVWSETATGEHALEDVAVVARRLSLTQTKDVGEANTNRDERNAH